MECTSNNLGVALRWVNTSHDRHDFQNQPLARGRRSHQAGGDVAKDSVARNGGLDTVLVVHESPETLERLMKMVFVHLRPVFLSRVTVNQESEDVKSTLLDKANDPAHRVRLEDDAEIGEQLGGSGLVDLADEVSRLGLIASSTLRDLFLLQILCLRNQRKKKKKEKNRH